MKNLLLVYNILILKVLSGNKTFNLNIFENVMDMPAVYFIIFSLVLYIVLAFARDSGQVYVGFGAKE